MTWSSSPAERAASAARKPSNWARRGARVVVNDLGGSPRGGGSDPTMARAVVDEIVSAGGEAVASGASVSSDDGPAQIVAAAMDTWGRIDGLIHNAAIVLDDHFEDVTDDDLDNILAVNLRGTFRTVRAVYKAMKENGGGRIVTLTSASGLSGAFGQAAYATTKMGVVGMTRSIAWEGIRFGIKVNALAPGRIRHQAVLRLHARRGRGVARATA